MKTKNILFLVLALCFMLSANAQKEKGSFDIETIRKEKAEFLKKELSLTDAEAKAFLPLEAEFTQKKFEVYRAARIESRELKKKGNKDDSDYQKITQLNLESEQKATQIQIEYYKRFSQVLSAEKIEKYRSADQKFNENLLKEYQQERKDNR